MTVHGRPALRRVVPILAAVGLSALLAGCACETETAPAAPTGEERAAARTAALCGLVALPARELRRSGRGFADAVAAPVDDDAGVGLSLAVLAVRYRYHGRYEPVLDHLARRATAALDREDGRPSRPPPEADRDLIRRAEALDDFLARGGCG